MSNTKKIAEDFNWDAYLAQTNAVAAPADCFWQAPDPPPNKFDDEMILEAYDPRFPSIRCIAEVTAVYGPKIRLRMLGAGDNDDIWIIVDSHQIRPIGTADNQGILIQAPFNCRCDASRFSKMKKAALAAGNYAPPECFIDEPLKPACNMFQIGQKLEACDTRDPVFVCPATVKDVKEEKILVEFDGWNTSEWLRYDSRDIFPVGWWQRSGAKIQNVPSKRKRGGHQGQKNRDSLTTTAGSSETPTTPDIVVPTKENSSVVDKLNGDIGNLFDRTTSNSDSASKVQPSSAPILPADQSDMPSFPLVTAAEKCFGIVKPRAKKTIAAASVAPMMRPTKSITPPLSSPGYITETPVSRRGGNNTSLSAGQLSSIEDAVESVLAASGAFGSQSTTNNNSSQNIKRLHSPVQRPSSAAELDVNGRHRSSSAAALSKQQFSLIYNSPPLDGTPDTCDFVVYLNAHCSTGRYLDRTKFLSVRNTRFGPSGVNHVMRACLQMLIDSAHPGDAANVLNCCTSDSSGSGPSLSADSNGSTLMRRLPVFKSQLDAWKYLAQVLDRLQTCPHLLAKRYDSCTACEPAHPSQPLSKKAKLSPTVDALFLDTNGAPSGSTTGGAVLIRGRHISGGSSSSTGTERGSTPNVNSVTLNDVSKWTVDEVTRFVYNASDSATADLFKRQEIDGKALLLLTADMMIRYMNVRLGPALKISNAIEGAKSGKTQNF